MKVRAIDIALVRLLEHPRHLVRVPLQAQEEVVADAFLIAQPCQNLLGVHCRLCPVRAV